MRRPAGPHGFARLIAPMLAKLMSLLLLGLIRLLTGAQARWYGCPPKAEQRIYFANHQSHADLVMIWAALPEELRSITRPIAAKDYWTRTPFKRWLTSAVFNAVYVERERKGNWTSWSIGVAVASLLGGLLAGITPFKPGQALSMAFIACVAGSLGHLVMKALKRDRGITNWGAQGQSLTGASGLLDRVDALCFAAPVFFHSVRWYFGLWPRPTGREPLFI